MTISTEGSERSNMSELVLKIQDLAIEIETPTAVSAPLESVSLEIREGQFVALVGESGSGKSLTARTIIGLMPYGVKSTVTAGSILFEGRDITGYSDQQMDQLRASDMSMIFQDPMAYLNPIMKIEQQIDEAIPRNVRGRQARLGICRELLLSVGLNDTERVLTSYPFNLSGGMRQRVLTAIALASNPKFLIADEPTTALDVTVQAKVLKTLKEVATSRSLTMLFITHDLGIVANLADYVYVMYEGRTIESGTPEQIFRQPQHEYTKGLVNSVRSLEFAESIDELVAIPTEGIRLDEIVQEQEGATSD